MIPFYFDSLQPVEIGVKPLACKNNCKEFVHDLSVVFTVVDDPLQNAFDLLLELETISEEVTPETRFGMILFSMLELYNRKRVFKTECYKSNCFSKALPECSPNVFLSPLFSCAV